MKTHVYKGVVISMIIVCISVALYGIVSSSKNSIPRSDDSQIITITNAEIKQGDEWVPITLPGYIDLHGRETIRCKLDYSFENGATPSFIMQANHSFLDVSLDGKTIYHVDPQPKSFGNYFVNTKLPSQVQGKYLEIGMSAPENSLHRIQLPELFIADEAVFLKQQLENDALSIVLNGLLFVVGSIMLALAFTNRKKPNFRKLLLQGLATLNLTVYFICETYTVVFLSTNSRLIYYSDMLSFSMIGTLLVLLFSCDFDDRYKKIFHMAAWVGIANTLLQLILSLTGVIELRMALPYTHILQVVSIVAVILCSVDSFRRHKKIESMFLLSVIIIGGLSDIVIFAAERNHSHNVFFLKIGILIYLSQQLYVYIKRFIQTIEENTRENYYRHLALWDTLTGCQSRISYEIDKREYKKSDVSTIFAFDINYLKRLNDIYGHVEGDNLLRTFGTLLILVFSEFGKCYRIGGDEFVVLCNNLQDRYEHDLIEKLNLEIDELNSNGSQKRPISYAVGICSTKETDGDFERASLLADKQMYENKQIMKSSVSAEL